MKAAFLNHRLFRGLSDASLKLLDEVGRNVRLKKGEVLIQEGDINSDLYLVLDGMLEVSLPSSAGRFSQVDLAKLRSGDCIGEYSYVDRKAASATVTAIEESELFRISHSDLNDLLDSHAELGRVIYKNLLSSLVARLRASNDEFDLFRPV